MTADILLMAYERGFFPMAEEDGQILWHRPDPRAVIPLNEVRLSKSLRKVVQRNTFRVTVNSRFTEVIMACAQREETWINADIIDAYTELHELGYAHSVEAWHERDLVGGLYGVALGGAFFGESMFSRMSNASKVAFAWLVEHLRQQRFQLLDTQYINHFTASLGAVEIADELYQTVLAQALHAPCVFVPLSDANQ